MSLLEKQQRLAEDRKHAAHLAGPAAGKGAKDRVVRRETVARPKGRTVASLHAGVDGGMADIGAGDAIFREEGNLEGQKRHDVIDPLPELSRPEGPPGPKLGRNVMDDRDAGAAEMVGEPETKAWRIDGHDGIGPEPPRRLGRLVETPDETRQMGQDLGEPHHGEVAHGKEADKPLASALRAPDAGKTDAAARLALERVHQPSGEVVTGRLARDDKDQRLSPVH